MNGEGESSMTTPDFERMTKDEILDWFDQTKDLSVLMAGMEPSTEPVRPPNPDGPMMLASIRLPVELVEQLDSLADLQGVRRSEVIRAALTAYVTEQTTPLGRDDAVHALDVLRRVVNNGIDNAAQAA